MNIYNLKEHQECFCYGTGKNALIEIKEIPCGTEEVFTLLYHEVVFMMEGELQYVIRDHHPVELVKGHFIFVPIGRTLNYTAKTNCLIFILRQSTNIRLCHSFSIEKLYNGMATGNLSGRMTPLEINSRLYHYIDGLKDTCEDGIMCRYFFETKIIEFFVLLRTYYSDEQLYGLFLPVLSPDTEFSEFVHKNHHKYKTIREMAKAMNFTTGQFTDRFRRVFSLSPREWMQQEKTKRVFTDICDTNKVLKQIAAEHGFAVQAHLIRFCRQKFDMTPGEMRKNRLKQNQGTISYQ